MKSVGSYFNALDLCYYMARKSWKKPTSTGILNLKERAIDAFAGVGFQLGASAYFELYRELARSTKWLQGTFERLYEREQNSRVKEIFRKYVEDFI
jgi:hypothetical protein